MLSTDQKTEHWTNLWHMHTSRSKSTLDINVIKSSISSSKKRKNLRLLACLRCLLPMVAKKNNELSSGCEENWKFILCRFGGVFRHVGWWEEHMDKNTSEMSINARKYVAIVSALDARLAASVPISWWWDINTVKSFKSVKVSEPHCQISMHVSHCQCQRWIQVIYYTGSS